MALRDLVSRWFELWEAGDYRELPLGAGFTHVSPFGTVEGRDRYLGIVSANEQQFLGYRFEIHDRLDGADASCVRYTALSEDGPVLEATEWFFGDGAGIDRIVSYYNVGDVSYDEFEEPAPQ